MKEVLLTSIITKIYEVPTDDRDEAIKEVTERAEEEIASIGWNFLKIDGFFLKKDEPANTLYEELSDIEKWLEEKNK